MSGPPGLAVERTVLAWTRTWLTVGAVALLLVRLGHSTGARAAPALAVGGTALLVLTATGRRRGRRLRALDPARPFDLAGRATLVTAVTTSLLGVAAAVLVAVH